MILEGNMNKRNKGRTTEMVNNWTNIEYSPLVVFKTCLMVESKKYLMTFSMHVDLKHRQLK